MKAAAAALILMAVLFTAAVLHGQYVDRLTECLTDLEASFPVKTAEKLPSDPTIGKAETVWQKADVLLSVTVNARQRIAVSTALRSVVCYYENGTASDYEAARDLLREALFNLKRAEEIGFRGLF